MDYEMTWKWLELLALYNVHSNVQCCSLLKLSFSLPLQFSLKLQILYMFPCVFLLFSLVSVALYFELLANSMFDMAVVSRCIGWNVYIWSSFYVHYTYNQVKTNGKVVEKRRTWSVWNDFFGIPTANSQIIWFKKISYVCHTENVFCCCWNTNVELTNSLAQHQRTICDFFACLFFYLTRFLCAKSSILGEKQTRDVLWSLRAYFSTLERERFP